MLRNRILQLLAKASGAPFRGMCFRAIYDGGMPKKNNLHPVNLAYNLYSNTDVDNGAPPLVIMHGLLGSKQNWNSISKALLQRLSPRRRIITVDARNHGESPHSHLHTYPHLVEDVIELFKELNIEKAAVLGHSMGGRAMMYMALKYPNLIERAVIVDISPVRNSVNMDGMEHIFQAIRTVRIPPELTMTQGRAKATRDLQRAVMDKATVDFIVLNLKKRDDGSFVWKANVEALHNNFRYISRFPEDVMKDNQYRGPVLFIGGSRSDFIRWKIPKKWDEIPYWTLRNKYEEAIKTIRKTWKACGEIKSVDAIQFANK